SHLDEALCHAYLVRCDHHGRRGSAVVDRPAAAHRRAASGGRPGGTGEMRTLAAFVLALVMAMPAFAVNPDEMLADPALEARARSISEGLRCLVCQNESIDESNADL